MIGVFMWATARSAHETYSDDFRAAIKSFKKLHYERSGTTLFYTEELNEIEKQHWNSLKTYTKSFPKDWRLPDREGFPVRYMASSQDILLFLITSKLSGE